MEAQLTVAKQVLERAEELHGADDPKLTAPLKQLGSIYNALGDYKSATEVCVCVSLSLPFLFGTPPRFYVCFGLDYPLFTFNVKFYHLLSFQPLCCASLRAQLDARNALTLNTLLRVRQSSVPTM